MATTTWPEYLGQLDRYLASVRLSIERGDPSLGEECPSDRPDSPLPDELRTIAAELFSELDGLASAIEARLDENVQRQHSLDRRFDTGTRPRHFSGLL